MERGDIFRIEISHPQQEEEKRKEKMKPKTVQDRMRKKRKGGRPRDARVKSEFS